MFSHSFVNIGAETIYIGSWNSAHACCGVVFFLLHWYCYFYNRRVLISTENNKVQVSLRFISRFSLNNICLCVIGLNGIDQSC